MPILEPAYRFTPVIVHAAPDNAGVFALWEDGELIFVGRATSIRQCLLDHLQRRICPCTTAATHYSWELALQPGAREVALLEEFKKRRGRLPRCNEAAA